MGINEIDRDGMERDLKGLKKMGFHWFTCNQNGDLLGAKQQKWWFNENGYHVVDYHVVGKLFVAPCLSIYCWNTPSSRTGSLRSAQRIVESNLKYGDVLGFKQQHEWFNMI